MTQDSRLHAEAFRKFIEVKEELSKDERELLQVGCAYFIESLLIGGDAERALKAMETNLTSPMPELSNVTGRKTLRGMVDLVFEPYATRQYIQYTTNILLTRNLDDGDKSTLPWLMQTIKYAFPNERGVPLQYLPDLDLTFDQIHAYLKDFTIAVMTQKIEPPAQIGDHISQFVQYISRPYWLYALAKVLSEFSHEELDRYKNIVNTGSLAYRFETSDLEAIERAVDIKALFDQKLPIFVSQIACAYLLRSQIDATEYKDLIVSRMQGAPYTFIASASNYLSEFQSQFSAKDLAIFKSINSMGPPSGGRMHEFSQAHMAIRALIENAQSRPSEKQESTTGDEWMRLQGKFQQILSIDENILLLPYIKTKIFTSMSECRTDDDEIGFLKIGKDKAMYFAIPQKFPISESGAGGAKRKVFIYGVFEGQKEFLLGIQEPFSNERGRGYQNLLFSFNLESESWSSWIPNPQDKEGLIRVQIASQIPACYGDINIKVDPLGKVSLVEDTTPSHDSYSGPSVERQLPGFVGQMLVRAPTVAPADSLYSNAGFKDILERPGFNDRLMNRWSTHRYNICTFLSPWELWIRTRKADSDIH